MGVWRTLHLFGDKIFYERTVPALRDPAYDLKPDYLVFMRGHVTGGIGHLPPDELNARVERAVNEVRICANQFDADFRGHAEFDRVKGSDTHEWLRNNPAYYDFGKFFEYFVFQTCTDFFPNLSLGKGGIHSKFSMDAWKFSRELPVADELFGILNYSPSLLCYDLMGVEGWISAEDVELLLMDRDKLIKISPEFMEVFGVMLEAARHYGLGLMVGVDMREARLEKLPQYKLTREDHWNDKRVEGLIFSR